MGKEEWTRIRRRREEEEVKKEKEEKKKKNTNWRERMLEARQSGVEGRRKREMKRRRC